MGTTTLPRPSRSAPAETKLRYDLSSVTSAGNKLPNRYLLHAVEGWGKTSFGAHTPSPIFIQTKGETGLETLINSGRLKETPHFPETTSWSDLLGQIEALTNQDHPYKTLVIDALNGAERLCHEHVCRRDYSDNWTDSGFMGYMRGYEVSLSDWRSFLASLDSLRAQKRMTILLLSHTRVKTFKNPEGADYDRYAPDVHEKTWSLTHKWSDCCLFGNYEVALTAVQENKKTGAAHGKAKGGNVRVMYTERHASYDAKNRLGLPEEIEMGNSPEEAWGNFMKALKNGKDGGKEGNNE